jgi:hypothetical protein
VGDHNPCQFSSSCSSSPLPNSSSRLCACLSCCFFPHLQPHHSLFALKPNQIFVLLFDALLTLNLRRHEPPLPPPPKLKIGPSTPPSLPQTLVLYDLSISLPQTSVICDLSTSLAQIHAQRQTVLPQQQDKRDCVGETVRTSSPLITNRLLVLNMTLQVRTSSS